MASSARHPDHQAQEVYYPRSHTAPGFSRRLEPIHGPAGFGASNQANKPSCDGSSAGNHTLGLKANARPANQSRCDCRVLPEAHLQPARNRDFKNPRGSYQMARSVQTLVAGWLPVEEYNQTLNNLTEATETLYSVLTTRGIRLLQRIRSSTARSERCQRGNPPAGFGSLSRKPVTRSMAVWRSVLPCWLRCNMAGRRT